MHVSRVVEWIDVDQMEERGGQGESRARAPPLVLFCKERSVPPNHLPVSRGQKGWVAPLLEAQVKETHRKGAVVLASGQVLLYMVGGELVASRHFQLHDPYPATRLAQITCI